MTDVTRIAAPCRRVSAAGRGVARRGAATRRFMVALCLLLAIPAVAGAEDDVVSEAETAKASEEQMPIDLDQQIGAMLIGGGAGVSDLDDAKRRVASGVDLQTEYLDRICGLDETQKRVFSTAAGLDAARTMTALQRLVHRYSGRVVDLRDAEGMREWHRFHEDFSGIREMLARPNRTRGLVSRVITRTLDERQLAAWEEEVRRRGLRRWRIAVDSQLASLESRLGLSGRQTDALEAMLMERPAPFDIEKTHAQLGDAADAAGRCAVGWLDPARVDAILDERQQEKFRPIAEECRTWEQMLRQQGVFDE